MSTLIKVARYHLIQRFNYLVLPWAALAFAFLVNLVIHGVLVPRTGAARYAYGLATIYVFVFILGLQTVARSLPFGLSIGLSRRIYYLGTVLLALTLAAVYGLALTLAQVVERATGGWGIRMEFFRLPYLLEGPWYVTWLTSFVLIALLFAYGIWFGLVYRRWNVTGVVAFLAGQVTVVLAGALVTTWTHTWHGIGHFFTALSANGLTGILAAVAAALLLFGFATMRRVTV